MLFHCSALNDKHHDQEQLGRRKGFIWPALPDQSMREVRGGTQAGAQRRNHGEQVLGASVRLILNSWLSSTGEGRPLGNCASCSWLGLPTLINNKDNHPQTRPQANLI